MQFTEIKKIRVRYDENYQMLPISIIDPNYTQYTTYLDKNYIMTKLVDKIIQDFAPYTLEKINEESGSYNLYFEDKIIKIEKYVGGIKFSINEKQYTFICFKNMISTYKVLNSLYELISLSIKNDKEKEFKEILKLSIENHDDFDFSWYNNDEDKEIILKYKPIGISILCDISSSNSIKFVSYLHGEGETYYNGEEKLTTKEIEAKIKYYLRLLTEQSIIQEKLLTIKF